MSESSKKTAAQKREMPEPYEAGRPIPRYVLLVIGAVFIWAIAYIWRTAQTNDPSIGDRRTAADFVVAKASTTAAIDGAQIYTAQCLACHQATGAGLPGVFPPLAGSEFVQGKPSALIQIALHGISGKLTVKGTVYNGQMPTFKDKLDDAQLAAVLSHVRSSFGNSAGKVEAADVKAARDATKDRATPWNGDEDLKKLE